MDLKLQGKISLVTGPTLGIGLAIAAALVTELLRFRRLSTLRRFQRSNLLYINGSSTIPLSGVMMNTQIIVQHSPYSVSETIERLESQLRQQNIPIFARIDHAAGAKTAGLALADEALLIFGDPKVGTYLMQENPMMGIELPLKILVWSQRNVTYLAYNDPLQVAKEYDLEKSAALAKKMADFMAKLVAEVCHSK